MMLPKADNLIWRALGEVERKPINPVAYWLRRLNRSWEKRDV